jgi:SAM-dependent methyltransferase
MADEGPGERLSRRSLLSLGFARGRWAEAPPPAVAPYRAVLRERWSAAGAFHDALAPLAGPMADAAGLRDGARVVVAGDERLRAEVRRRGATVMGVGGDDDEPGVDPVAFEQLPFPDGTADAVLAGLVVAFAPRPVATARELLRVLAPDGALVLAAPAPGSFLAAALALAVPHDGVPAPAAWGREPIARGRLDTARPGVEVTASTVRIALELPSEEEAWRMFSGPLGLPPQARDEFARLVDARPSEPARGAMEEPVALYTLALACRR